MKGLNAAFNRRSIPLGTSRNLFAPALLGLGKEFAITTANSGLIYAFKDRGFDRGIKIGRDRNRLARYEIAHCYSPQGID